jgi:methylthioribose-1-phosphate isomerase
MPVVSIKWFAEASGCGGHLELLDQTKLPLAAHWIKCDEAAAVIDAIKRLAVRGAPAIGIAGAYAYCLAAQQIIFETPSPDAPRDGKAISDRIVAQSALIAAARPTAVNLQWAVDRMSGVLARCGVLAFNSLALIRICSFLPESLPTQGAVSSCANLTEVLLALCQEVCQVASLPQQFR